VNRNPDSTPGSGPPPPPASRLQEDVVALLRDRLPAGDFDPAVLEACLMRYECGGYVHAAWTRGGRASRLPAVWAAALARAHHRTVVDNLVALAQFRSLGAHLHDEHIPFILLKGASYLVDLHDDPGARMLTDIDLLIRREDAGRIARRLRQAGYEGRFEFHWHLGLPLRMKVDQGPIWEAATDIRLEGVACRRLSTEHALLYHVGHLADHYFGPSLKWTIDLREMLRRWKPDPDRLLACSARWRVRMALYVALLHVDKLFPGEAPAGLLDRLAPGALRRHLLERSYSTQPAEMMVLDRNGRGRFAIRPLLVDRPLDALALGLRIALRPLNPIVEAATRRATPPWEWSI
jgi:hypothetical protein